LIGYDSSSEAIQTLQLAPQRDNGHVSPMELTLPKPLEARLSPKDAALHLAIGLFVSEEATLGQAAQTAGLSQADFLRELGSRHIPIHYGQDELDADLRAVESLATR
jgi:predicted HTH domain antitoxin